MVSIPANLKAKLVLQGKHTFHQDQLLPQKVEQLAPSVRRISEQPNKMPHR